MRLKGKVAIITGAGSGIGRAAAILFASEGASVVVADINEKKGQETVGEIRRQGGCATFIATVVTRAADVKAMVEHAVNTFGRLDILYNHCGINKPGKATELSEEDWDAVINTNLKSVFLGAKYAIPK